MRTYENKDELKNEINKSFAKYISEFNDIPEHLKDKRIDEVDRTPAENLAYQVGWTTLVIKWESDERKGIPVKTPSDNFKWNQLGELYQWFTDTYAHLSLQELKDMLNENINSIYEIIDSLSDEELFEPHMRKWADEATKTAVRATIAAVKVIIAGTKALISALIAGGWVSVVIILIVVLLGCAVSLFGGGGGSNAYTPVSAEVEAYEPLIQKYAKQYGIPEYVELIKAVMMQESGGRGLDPMQAAEGSFNTRYPHEPNGIQDPEYSIQCGVQELKAALISAEVENPIDMEHIKLALQGYNFGNGYISWAKTNYGGYSYANAVEFSTMQAQRLGWESYGDTQYPAHVLRYYPYGRAFTSGGNQAIVEVALTQLGNEGGQPYWSWYGFDGRVEWCACFVSWCADQCGYLDSGIVPKFAGCVDGANWFKGNGQWQDRNYEPTAGTIIFFDWENDGETDHVGIVEKCENGVVYTVEGNSGDACRQNQYSVGSSSIYGYGIPAY